MDARQYLKEKHRLSGFTDNEMAKYLGVSVEILRFLENGGVTHPQIAKKIARKIKLRKTDARQFMPPNWRKGTPEYDPTKYMDEPEIRCYEEKVALSKGCPIPASSLDILTYSGLRTTVLYQDIRHGNLKVFVNKDGQLMVEAAEAKKYMRSKGVSYDVNY